MEERLVYLQNVEELKVLHIIQEYFRTKFNSLPHLLYIPINMSQFPSQY